MKKLTYFIVAIVFFTGLSLIYLRVSFAEEFEGWEDEEDFWLEEGSEGEDDLKMEDDGDREIADENIVSSGDYAGIVSMKEEFLDGDILKISIVSEEMLVPILGMAFNLIYDKEKTAFLKYEPGNFLERGGDPFYLVKNEEDEEKIVFGETLRKNDSFPLGEGKVADFYFQILERDGLEFSFANGVVSTMDTVRQDIEKILWENLVLEEKGKKIMTDAGGNDVIRSPDSQGKLMNFGLGLAMGMGLIVVVLVVLNLLKRRRKNCNLSRRIMNA